MSTEVEELEAAIIKVAYSGSYSHAENVLHRLRLLEGEVGHNAAVRQLHKEVVG